MNDSLALTLLYYMLNSRCIVIQKNPSNINFEVIRVLLLYKYEPSVLYHVPKHILIIFIIVCLMCFSPLYKLLLLFGAIKIVEHTFMNVLFIKEI